MNPVRSIKNQYVGINAHLHSVLLDEGRWGGFHTAHIAALANGLRAKLRLMGYTAEIEESLQIRRLGEGSSLPKADLLIYDTQTAHQFAHESVLEIPLLDLLEDELSDKPYRALAIYEVDERRNRAGTPVAWIELLSPSNKGNTSDAGVYQTKRLQLLESGIVFVELDYLHETPPTFKSVPAHLPYRLIVIDPRPVFHDGRAQWALFGADEPFPPMRIPLNRGDLLDFDFGQPYQQHFSDSFLGDRIDYSQYPVNFDRYTPADQTRIANRMIAVLEAAQAGVDLETGPFPVPNYALVEAQARIAALTAD